MILKNIYKRRKHCSVFFFWFHVCLPVSFDELIWAKNMACPRMKHNLFTLTSFNTLHFWKQIPLQFWIRLEFWSDWFYFTQNSFKWMLMIDIKHNNRRNDKWYYLNSNRSQVTLTFSITHSMFTVSIYFIWIYRFFNLKWVSIYSEDNNRES